LENIELYLIVNIGIFLKKGGVKHNIIINSYLEFSYNINF